VKRYVVRQPFRGMATFLVEAHTAAEALAKVNGRGGGENEGVECVDRDAVRIYKAVFARRDRPRKRRNPP
jgi:hypothetical protein